MPFQRSSGVLLHPTSFPGKYGIGDLGSAAFQWIDWLKGARQKLWQILPLGPTGYGDSPYQCFSAFAGNPYLLSPELLFQDGLLSQQELDETPNFPQERVDFGWIYDWKMPLLERVYQHWVDGHAKSELKPAFKKFRQENASWLPDYALFMALKDEHNGSVWSTWEPDLVQRKPAALKAAHKRLASQIESQELRQFLFFRQWQTVREYAHQNGIQIIGDIPIFVAYDSADVWQNPELFYLDADGKSTVVAGEPPDYFSATGQLWGNPLYNWEKHRETGYAWWIKRIQAVLNLVDIIRIDHFRGFDEYWEIPATAPTAVTGKWVSGPKHDFFNAMRASLGDLPIIAEDLGLVTPGVQKLRDDFQLPGMKILQFAFGGDPNEPFLPHNYPENCVAYTGTHDNDTTLGWYLSSSNESERDYYRRYYSVDGNNVVWDLIHGIWRSRANQVLCPLQDLLCLDSSARMNYPGRAAGNWTWRFSESFFSDRDLQARLRFLTEETGRTA